MYKPLDGIILENDLRKQQLCLFQCNDISNIKLPNEAQVNFCKEVCSEACMQEILEEKAL